MWSGLLVPVISDDWNERDDSMFSTYQLGILRCCSVYSDFKIVVKGKYRYFLEQLQPALSLGIYQSNKLSIMCDFFMSQDPCFLDFWRKGIKMLKDLG